MLAALVLLVVGSVQVEDVPRKSDAAIIKMGRSKWFEFYTSKAGDSTAAMCDAESFFGEALLRTNDKELAKQAQATRRFIGSSRTLMADYRNALIELGSVFSGGGTMWNPVYAGTLADVEEVVAAIIEPRKKAKKAWMVSGVTKPLAAWGPKLRGLRDDADVSKSITGGYDRGVKCLAIADAKLAAMTHLLKTQNRRVSDLVLEFCFEQTKLPNVAVGD